MCNTLFHTSRKPHPSQRIPRYEDIEHNIEGTILISSPLLNLDTNSFLSYLNCLDINYWVENFIRPVSLLQRAFESDRVDTVGRKNRAEVREGGGKERRYDGRQRKKRR